MLFYSVVIGSLFQVMRIQGFSGNEIFDGAEREDIVDGGIWSKNEVERVIPDGYSDLSRALIEKEQLESDLLKRSSIPKEVPDFKNFFLGVESYTNIPLENGTIDIQSFLNEIESNKVSPAKTVTFDFQEIMNEIESNTFIPEKLGTISIQDIQYKIQSDLNGPYRSIYTARGIAGVIGIIIALICAPLILYKKYKARKDFKLRVFVISRKSEKKEPLISV